MPIQPKSVEDSLTLVENKISTLCDEVMRLRLKVSNLSSLFEIGGLISSTLDLSELLNLIMQKAQEVMNAEASCIMLINLETGMLEWEVALGEVGETVKQRVQLKLGEGIAGWVAQTGEALNVPDVSVETRFSSKSDEKTGFKTRSILCVPLKVKGLTIGIAEVLNKLDSHPFDADDEELFTTFCSNAAIAIENARMHKSMLEKERLDQQLELAATIQKSFLPQGPPKIPNVGIAAANLPAAMIGGDFYDFIAYDNSKLGVAIGDVSGKGMPAALFMARLISDFRFQAQLQNSMPKVLDTINKILIERSTRGMFVSLLYLLLDTTSGTLSYANCGHLPMIICRQDTKNWELAGKSNQPPLGILRDLTFKVRQIQMLPGDVLLMFTDGIIEAKNKDGEAFALEKLCNTLGKEWNDSSTLVSLVMNEIDKFSRGAAQHDDMTLVALKWC